MTDHKNKVQHATSYAYLTRRTALKGLGAAGLATLFVAQGVPLARAQTDAYRKLTITAKNYRFELPPSIPGGYTEITLKNEGPQAHHAMFMRLHKGKTVADFMNATKSKGMGALFAISSSVGGPGSIDPGQESTVILNLKAGQYVVICIVPDATGMPHYKMGMLAPLTVVAASQTGSAPTAETTIDLIDFSFIGLPKEIPAEKRLWKVIDTGKQLHEMVVHRLAPGVTFEQAKAILLASPPPGSAAALAKSAATPVSGKPEPFTAVAGVAPMSPGEINWAVLDLKPASYFVVCFIPDTKSGAPHFALGMIMPFTVSVAGTENERKHS